MKKTHRLKHYVMFQLLFIYMGYVLPLWASTGSSSMVQSVGSCSGPMGSSLTGSENDGDVTEGSFITGEPIDIPAPVAKGIDGIDPASVRFVTGSGGLQLEKAAHIKGATTDDTVGQLEASLLGAEEALVGLVQEGVFVDIQSSDNLQVSFPISTDMIDVPLALVVLSETSTAEAIEAVSDPLIIIINSPGDVSDEYRVKVTLTNIDVDTSEFSFSIIPMDIAVSSTDLIALQGVEEVGDIQIATYDTSTSTYALLTSEFPNGLTDMGYFFSDDQLFGINEDDLTIEQINFSGINSSSDAADGELARTYCVSPDGTRVASNRHDHMEDNEMLQVTSIGDSTITNYMVNGGEMFGTITDLFCVWIDDETIAVRKTYESGHTILHSYPVGPSDFDVLTPDVLFQPTTLPPTPDNLQDMVVDPNDSGVIYVMCELSTMGVCKYESGVGTSAIYHAVGLQVSHMVVTSDSRYLIIEVLAGAEVEERDNAYLVVLDLDTFEATVLMAGFAPAVSSVDPNLFYYLSYVEGEVQLGVYNLEHL